MNDLLKRSLSGVAYVVIIAASVLLHPFIFIIVFSVVHFFLLREFRNISFLTGFRLNFYLNLIAGLILTFLVFLIAIGLISPIFLISIAPLILIFPVAGIFRNKHNAVGYIAASITGFFYISFPLALLSFLIFPDFPSAHHFNPLLLMGVLIILWMYDTFAYLVGTFLGKHKLMEEISPKKSWEGVIGGGISALIVSVLLAVVLKSSSLKIWIGIALIIVIFGTLGDLFESLLKRKAGIKDSGNIIPGHGGLLDRMDSLLFIIAPVLAWLWISLELNF